ncbi:monocarboxylate transporter 13-like [Eriocheir sinensis]|uniref:monocarboxylate transporter 13-like n=1 Tax=Eriocheir sinensis TaxID=95602 RepID=UPI0021CA7A35|nr:monocarboxylate transporter 13-like [Eriocheir sinensis]
MTPSPAAEHLPLPEAKLGYLNETFDPDENCSCNVPRDATNSSRGRCQCETPKPTKNTSTPTDISSEEAHHATDPRAAEGGGRENRNSRVVKSKTVIDVEFEKNDEAFQHKSVDNCDSDSTEAEAPEGGWGYIVLLGAFIIAFMNGLGSLCFGILFTDFLLEAGASLTTTAALITTYGSVMCLAFLLAGPLLECWGWRTVVMGGGILFSSGLIITAFSPSVEFLFFSYSLLTGFGTGVCTVAALGIPSFYFKRKRGMASSFVLCGVNVGGFAGPPLVAYLLREYGFRGATLITAAITLHVCFSATVFHPVEWHTPRRGNDKARAPIKPKNKRTMVSTLTCYWRLLKYARTYVIIVAFAAINGILRTAVSLVSLVLETNGHTREDAAFITSIVGVCGFVGRLVVSSVADTAWFNVRVGYIALISVAIVSLIVFSATEEILWITVAMALHGVGMSGCYSLGPLLMVNYMGLKNLMPLLALAGITTAVFQPAITPLFGVFETLTGGYSGPILFLSSEACLAGVLWLLMPLAEAFDKRRITHKSSAG